MKPKEIKTNQNVEVDEVLWYNIKDVENILSYDSDKQLIKDIRKILGV